jgi:cystathionine beta-synthase
VPDGGGKYLSKMYNDFWMFEQGLLARPRRGTLADLIVRRHQEGSAVTVKPGDSLMQVYRRMKLYEVSQLPVVDGGRIVGIVDESDLLVHVQDDPERFKDAVSAAMVREVETVPPDAPISALLPVFQRDHVAVVAEQGRLVGLVTRIDLLNHLRRQLT